MEATGVYWKPVWDILEDDFELTARQRASRQAGAGTQDRRLRRGSGSVSCSRPGCCAASFVPPKPQRRLRNLTRYRKAQIAERQREANRLHKIARGHRASSSTASRPTSSARPAGRCSTRSLPARPTPRCSPSWPRASCARSCRRCGRRSRAASSRSTHWWSARSSSHLDFLDEQIDLLSDAIEEQIRPFGPAVELPRTIPGVQHRTAEVILAEIGTDMSVFPTAGHLASWAGDAPATTESAGKRRSGRTRKGSSGSGSRSPKPPWPRPAQDTYLSAQYRRLKPRLGHRSAIGAVKTLDHRRLLAHAQHRRDLPRRRQRLLHPPRPRTQTKRLIAKLERLGHTVTLEPAAA